MVFPKIEGEVRRLFPRSPFLPFLSNNDLIVIDDLSDLESAGVWASCGYLESIKYLKLQNLDVTNVPLNIRILSSLTRAASFKLIIREVDGFELSVLDNLKSIA